MQNKFKLFFISILLISFFGWADSSMAATIEVDWDTGTDDVGCGAVNDPCKSPWATQLTSQLQPGDTVIIGSVNGGGVYYNASGGVIEAMTAGVTWQAAVGETVWLSATNDHTSNPFAVNSYSAGRPVYIGAANVVIDGFYVWGNITVGSSGDQALIKNCDLSGGSDRDGFPSVIRTTGGSSNPQSAPPSDYVDDLKVQNNKIHGNVLASGDYPVGGNTPLIMVYDARRMIIENNEFYDGLYQGIRFKDNSNQHTVRYNWFHDIPNGVSGTYQYSFDWIKTYNNIFTNITQGAVMQESGAANGFFIYNNIFYNCNVDIGYWNGMGGTPNYIFNNIQYHNTVSQWFQSYDSNWIIGDLAYQNYNDYYSTQSTPWRINSSNRASTLSGWQTWLDGQGAGTDNGDDNSIDTDPNFSPVDGILDGDNPTDFKRSTYPTNGRGGSYSNVMGAYITGSECIGLLDNCSGGGDTTAPAAPGGLSVI